MKTQELITEVKELPKQLREEFLRNHCTNVSVGQYFKRFDDEDLSQQEKELANKSIELSILEDQFDEVKNEWKAKVKEKKEEWKNALTLLKQNGEWLNGEQFMFADQKRGVMEFYDKNGDFVSSRRLLPEEKQMSIFDTDKFSVTAKNMEPNMGTISKSNQLGE